MAKVAVLVYPLVKEFCSGDFTTDCLSSRNILLTESKNCIVNIYIQCNNNNLPRTVHNILIF